jgi:hypothetical protein
MLNSYASIPGIGRKHAVEGVYLAEKPFAEKSRRMLWAEVTIFSSPAVSLSNGGTGSNLQAHSLLLKNIKCGFDTYFPAASAAG